MTSLRSSDDILNSLASPESPDENKLGDILFVEDRRPGKVSPVKFNLIRDKDEDVETENFISLGSEEEKDDEKLIESDNKINYTSDSDEDSNSEMAFIEDRNPLLSGQYIQTPKYIVNDNFLKLQDPKAANKKARPTFTCWNCGETSHSLRECKEPRDYHQIAKCRKEFQESRGNIPVYKRYHKEEAQKFEHLIPGQLSEELRHALGLEPQQLPTHIYMMRRLGYPPGWLEEATVYHSGISMFDGQGKEVLAPGLEGGEIVDEGMLDKYDARKFVQYPGFNVLPPPNTYDDSSYWNCPPMSRMQSLEVMLQKLEGRVVGGYKRKKLSLNATISSEGDETSQSNESQEMDYEEVADMKELPADDCGFVPPLPEEELPPPPPTELPPCPSTELPSDSSNSPLMNESSLIELEEQKKQLLAQLNDVSPLCSTPKSRVGKIKSVDLGTPILKSVSPYARLPTAKNFSVNICDVINFENLPDSTGKYDKISGIIRKVRTRLAELNDEI